ncbi:HNH endonuclease [Mycobacterium phage NoShow]|nr:HNH endonuclease [Mycobacterium phage NoShow]
MPDYPRARGWEWSAIREEKLRDNRRTNDGRCEARLSGCLGVAEEVHHVVARVDGGTHNDQLLAVCSACHYRFTTETVQQRAALRREQKKQKKRKNHPGRKDRHEPD